MQPQIVNPDEPIPPGTRQVTQTTVAKFTEPIASSSELVEDEPEPEIELADEDLGEEEEVELSPLDRFLASLSEADDAVIYVRRKTDPPGLQRPFKNQWTSPIVTIGEIPYDESFTDKTAIDLAVQKIFGGGYFQLQIRRSGGQILKTWSTLIADVVDARPIDATPRLETSTPALTNPADEIRRAFELVRDFKDVLGIQQQRPVAPPQLPPTDPGAEFQKTVNMFTQMTTAMETLRGPVSSGGEDGGIGATLVNGVVSLLRDPNIGPGAGALLAAIAAKVALPPQTNGALPPQQNGNGQQQPHVNPQSEIRNPQSEAPPQQPQSSPADIAFAKLLRRCAADMDSSSDHCDEYGEPDEVCDEDVAVAATMRIVKDFPDYRPRLDNFLAMMPPQIVPLVVAELESKPLGKLISELDPTSLVQIVAAECQDPELMQNPGSVLFAADLQQSLRAALAAQDSGAGNQEPEPPPSGGSESTVVKSPNQTQAADGRPQEAQQ